jgi:hypothetical protein
MAKHPGSAHAGQHIPCSPRLGRALHSRQAGGQRTVDSMPIVPLLQHCTARYQSALLCTGWWEGWLQKASPGGQESRSMLCHNDTICVQAFQTRMNVLYCPAARAIGFTHQSSATP